jgi:cell division protein FtsI (penicillin-binding protein 3)
MKPAGALPDLARHRWRSALIGIAFAIGAVSLLARVLYLQIVHQDFLIEQADSRHLRTVEITAHRGQITDRRGEPLAVSTPVDSVYANPQELRAALDRLGELARALDIEEDALARRVTSNLQREFVYLRRHIMPSETAAVLALGLPGVGTVREYRRYYPAGEVTGHLLGFTDIDDTGQEGLELAFDYWLRGENGAKRVMRDRLGRTIRDVEQIRPARPGRTLATSIDLRVQYLAYRELRRAVTETGAIAGSAVVLDPRTGELLAAVNQPAYNPNNRAQRDATQYRNRGTTDIFEPGSSFKPFVLAAALETGRYHPQSLVDTSPGFLRVAGRTITQDRSNLGEISLTTVLARSSNVGIGRVALELEPEQLGRVLSGFGIGRLTGSGFPGESAGVLNEPRHWRAIGQATLSYGYGLSVTTLQLARAYAAIAAGGEIRPVSVLALDEPVPGERVISRETAAQLTAMLEAVVSTEGTAQRAAVRNYRVAGKTGTAWKASVGGYSRNRFTAAFGGFVPATDPRLVVVVVIDEPQGEEHYGGEVAAPVFERIASGALRLLAIAPDALPEPPVSVVAQAEAH